MRYRLFCLASAVLVAVLLFSFSASIQMTRAVQGGGAGSTVFFVVTQSAPQYAQIVPILLIENGSYKQPVAGDSDAAEINRFRDAYYSKGRKYRMIFGGGSAGSVTVKERGKIEECFATGANVTPQTQARLNRNVMALATNSETLGNGRSARRAPINAERAAAVALAKSALQKNGVAAALLPTMETVNLTAVDLNDDGKSELVGTFVAKKTRGGAARYVIFLLAEPDGASYKPSLALYKQIKNDEIMSGGEISAVEQAGIYAERLLDYVDLDGDGTSELFTLMMGFEGDTYTIYSKKGGGWTSVYEFGNYRCAF